MGRAPCCEKVGLKKGRWTPEEDKLLLDYIKANGEGSWRSLPKSAGLLRCGKSCRLRWINYLREGVKLGNISEEEEETILKLRASLGNKWSLIASHLPGRTDNEIKNYWNSHLSKKAREASSSTSSPPSSPSLDTNPVVTKKKKRSNNHAPKTITKKMKKKHSSTGEEVNDSSNEVMVTTNDEITTDPECEEHGGSFETDLLEEIEKAMEEVDPNIMDLLEGVTTSSLTEEHELWSIEAKETTAESRGGEESSSELGSMNGAEVLGFEGFEGIPWEEEEEDMWKLLSNGVDLQVDSMPLFKEDETFQLDNFESWLYSDIF